MPFGRGGVAFRHKHFHEEIRLAMNDIICRHFPQAVSDIGLTGGFISTSFDERSHNSTPLSTEPGAVTPTSYRGSSLFRNVKHLLRRL